MCQTARDGNKPLWTAHPVYLNSQFFCLSTSSLTVFSSLLWRLLSFITFKMRFVLLSTMCCLLKQNTSGSEHFKWFVCSEIMEMLMNKTDFKLNKYFKHYITDSTAEVKHIFSALPARCFCTCQPFFSFRVQIVFPWHLVHRELINPALTRIVITTKPFRLPVTLKLVTLEKRH